MTICSRFASVVVLGVLLASPQARAQAEDQAAARSLFDEGRKLMKAGKYDDACPKLEAASKLYASAGILLNLGDCFEKIGRTASAWTEFGQSAAVADRADRRDQAAEAKRRQAALEPKLARLTIHVPREVPGLVVSRDSTDLGPAAWGSAIPVDAGAHEIRAHAAGREPWATSVTVSAPGQTVSVEVPKLAPSAVAATSAPLSARDTETSPNAAPSPFVETPPVKPSSRALGFALLGGGAAVGIGGAVLMIVESGRASSARRNDSIANSAASVDQYNSTKTPYYLGLAGAIVGGVAAASGVFLITTTHGGSVATTALRATPWVAACGGGLAVERAW